MKNTKVKKTEFEQFAYWVADEIFKAPDDEDDFEDNDFDVELFCEMACHKLNKLGIVQKKGTLWHYKDANLYL